ncbi:MAG: TolC family protein [Arachidicoccus sp.]|nr:TolC family protein [Arachidicoccus sp.]
MNFRRALGIFFYLSLSFSLKAQQNESDTVALVQLWEKAERNNKQLNTGRLSLQQMKQHTAVLRDDELPEISAHGEYERVSGMPQYEDGLFHNPTFYPVIHQAYTLGAEAMLNVYNGGTTKRNIRANKIEEDIASEKLNLNRSEIRYQIAVDYLDIYRNLQYKSLIEQDIKERQQQDKQIQSLFSKGVVLKSDVLRAELNLSKQQELLTQVENSITIANQSLNQLTGDEENHTTIPLMIADSMRAAFPLLSDNYFNNTTDHSYEYNILQKHTEQTKLQLQQVKSSLLPKIGLFAEYQYAYPQIQFYPYADAIYGLGMAGVRASFSLSELYMNKKKQQEAQTKIDRSIMETQDFADKLKVQISTLQIRYNEALQRITIAKQHIATASETYRITHNSYFAQLSLLTDLLDAETQLLQAKMDHTTEQVNAEILYYQLQKTIGNL